MVKCPFCESEIDDNCDVCEHCGSIFTPPELKNFKFKEFRVFLVLQLITFGLFQIIWFIINYKEINKLLNKKEDRLNLYWIILPILFYIVIPQMASLLIALIMIYLTYKTLKMIKSYTFDKYNIELDINPYYVWIFSVFYLVHFIDTYEDRVLNNHTYYNFRTPQGFVLIVMLAFIAFIINSGHSCYLRTLF